VDKNYDSEVNDGDDNGGKLANFGSGRQLGDPSLLEWKVFREDDSKNINLKLYTEKN
jgi:hypothetical protein